MKRGILQEMSEEAVKRVSSDSKIKRLLKLFISMFYISTFTFGGGFVIVSIMKKKFVDELHWLDEKEMLDFTALAQSSPGAIAVNAAILVGWRIAGALGMVVAVIGTILPPMIILTLVSFCYAAFVTNPYVALVLRGMQAGVAAVVLDVACGLFIKLKKEGSRLNILIMIAAFAASFFFDINVIYIILGAAALGIAHVLICRREEAQS